jgi:hypothetical protein
MPSAAQALPTTQLLGEHGPAVPLKNAAQVTKDKWGFIYAAGQQDSRLTVTYEGRRVWFRDTGTQELRRFPKRCRAEKASTGIAVSCRIAGRFNASNPTFIQIWPRLGDDYIDASSMPAMFRMWVLGDAGNDVAMTGAGDDFINGAQDHDQAWGGAGDDWIRTGLGNDKIWGQDGDDRLNGVVGNDQIDGGAGDDRTGGGDGHDELTGGPGKDLLGCQAGKDTAWADGLDKLNLCETINRY